MALKSDAATPSACNARKRGRPPADRAQGLDEAALLGAAFSMFATRGYEATSLRELSRQLGISHNLLSIRFGSKEALWKGALDWRLSATIADVVTAFDRQGDPESRLRDLIFRFCIWAVSNAEIVSLGFVEAQRDTWRLDYFVEKFVSPFKLQLDRLMVQVKHKRPVNAIPASALLALLVHGVGSHFASRPLRIKLDAADREAALDEMRQASVLAEFISRGLLGSD